MAFVLSQSESYTWPVAVEFPIDGGRFDKQTFDVQFKRLPQVRIREIWDAIQAGEMTDDDLCNEVVIGWSGVQDAKGEDVPFSEKAKADLLNVPLVASSIVTAWLDSLAKAKRKN
jgi:hypothetical protein